MTSLLPSSGSPRKAGYGSLSTPQAPPSPSAASLFSRVIFSYANPVMAVSNQRQLGCDDIWEIEGDNLTAITYAKFRGHFNRHGHSLLQAAFRTYGLIYALCGLGFLFSVGCGIGAPAVLRHVIDSFAAPVLDMQNLLIWLGLFFAAKIADAFVAARMNFHLELAAQRLSAALKALLFDKAMRRSIQSKGDDDSVDIANLYSSDVDGVLSAAFEFNKAWVLPIQILGVVGMLYNILGVAAFAGLAALGLSMGGSFLIANVSSNAFEDIMEHKDTRMKLIKEVFGAIQVIKLNAWESKFADKIRTLRAKEMTAISRFMYSEAVSILMLYTTPMLVSISSFAVYTLVLGNTLTAAKVFSSMALFNSLRVPLRDLPDVISECIQAKVSLDRMQEFLSIEEFDSSNVIRDGSGYASDVAIQIKNGSFGWSKDRALLKNVDLTVKKGDFVVVHGAVGAGKSSLCSALLGEMDKLTGSVFVRGRVAYYSQQAWIQNMSIRDNILFGNVYDHAKYQRVVDACGLVTDLEGFSAGDATEIGSKGVNLSGGQKARLCLARACYADADVLILDSPLAAVDAVVRREIFRKCLCDLLADKTVVLVTHAPDIIASEVANTTVEVVNGELRATRCKTVTPRRVYAKAHGKDKVVEEAKPVDAETTDATVSSPRLIEAEVREEGRVSKAVFLKYFNALGGKRMCLFLVTVQCLSQGFQIRSDFWLSSWTGQKAGAYNEADTAYNMKIYALLGLGVAFMVFVRTVTVSFLGIRAARNLFEWLTHSLLNAPLRFFDATPIGRILTRYGADMSLVDFRLPFGFGGFLNTSIFTICQLATAIYTVNFLGFLVVPLMYIYVTMANFYLAPSREVSRLEKVAASPVLSHVTASEEGVVVLRAFGAEYIERAVIENCKRVDVGNKVFYAETVICQWFQVRMQLIGAGVVIAIVSSLVYFHDVLSPGVVGLAFVYALNVDGGLIGLVRVWSYVEVCMVSPERILEYASLPAEGETNMLQLEPAANWPAKGSVEFENVVFSYKPGTPAVLKGLNFSIGSNENIGIVGRTGAGKSSLTMALFRINELDSGRVLIDGVNIASVPLHTLRSRLSIIPQSPVLFKGSLRAYMDPFDEFTDAEIWSAFEQVEMKQTIAALDGQLAYELSENGDNFSVGERQMLCMARAMLTKAKIVVLDEATASIDHATEEKLQLVINRAFQHATVLTIAHRLVTVLESDRIMVLSDGKVVEFDTPTQLAKNTKGVFYKLASEGGVLDKVVQQK